MRLQQCDDLDRYCAVLKGLYEDKHGRMINTRIALYLLNIHTINWCVLANIHFSELADFTVWKGLKAYGMSNPLFGVRTTSSVKGGTNGQ